MPTAITKSVPPAGRELKRPPAGAEGSPPPRKRRGGVSAALERDDDGERRDAADFAPRRAADGRGRHRPPRSSLVSPSSSSIPVSVRSEMLGLKASLRESEARADLYHNLYREEKERRIDLELRLELSGEGQEDVDAVTGAVGRAGAQPVRAAAAAEATSRGHAIQSTPPLRRADSSGIHNDRNPRRSLHRRVDPPQETREEAYRVGNVDGFAPKLTPAAAAAEDLVVSFPDASAPTKAADPTTPGRASGIDYNSAADDTGATEDDAALDADTDTEHNGPEERHSPPDDAPPNEASASIREGSSSSGHAMASSQSTSSAATTSDEATSEPREPAAATKTNAGRGDITASTGPKNPTACRGRTEEDGSGEDATSEARRDARLTRDDGLWYQKYNKLRNLSNRNGGHLCNINRSDEKLAIWIRFQRIEYRKYYARTIVERKSSKMTSDKIEALKSLAGFEFDSTYPERQNAEAEGRRDAAFDTVRDYWEAHGQHLKIGRLDRSGATWKAVSMFRNDYYKMQVQEGRPLKYLTQNRIDALTSMGVFDERADIKEGRQESWNEQLRELTEWKEAHGHVHIHHSVNKTLCNFVSYQRTKYKLGTLSDERREALEALGVLLT